MPHVFFIPLKHFNRVRNNWIAFVIIYLSIGLISALTFAVYYSPSDYNPTFSLVSVSKGSSAAYLGPFGSCQTSDGISYTCTRTNFGTQLWDMQDITAAAHYSTMIADIFYMNPALRLITLEVSVLWPGLFVITLAFLHWGPKSRCHEDILFFGACFCWVVGVSSIVSTRFWLAKAISDAIASDSETHAEFGHMFWMLECNGGISFVSLIASRYLHTISIMTDRKTVDPAQMVQTTAPVTVTAPAP